jgi:hypothetical protein
MRKLSWTLAALAALGGTAAADDDSEHVHSVPAAMTEEVSIGDASARGVAEDYLVLPSGGELTGQMKFITADGDPELGGQPLRFTDLALFGVATRWSITHRIEVASSVDFLAKQPSVTDEKPWQSAGATVRAALRPHIAIALSGSAGHLMAHTGLWAHEGVMLEYKKTIDRQLLAFDMQGGVDSTGLYDRGATGALMTEVGLQTSALFREPTGHWGAWIGIAYAVPVQKSGRDPTTDMAIDPRPRVDFHVGTVLAIVKDWDLFADLAWVDRGDLAMPATRLPILDGGFDQRQVVFGVTRHFDTTRRHDDDYDDSGAMMRL